MDHTKQLGSEPILKLIIKFSVPSVISMFVNAIYNIVDRIFVGQFVGEDALGGLTIAFPVMMVVFAVGTLFGVGGATMVSIKFGERNFDQANRIYGNLALLSLSSSFAMAVIGEIFLPSILELVGATPTVLPYAHDYMQIILLGLVFQLSSFAMAALARSEGKPFLSMMTQLVSAITNIILDYLFVVPLGMGVRGAAIATVIGQFMGFAILFRYFFISKKSLLKLHVANLRPRLKVIKSICVTGASSFVINIGQSISATFMNVALSQYGGNAAITSMGAINSLITLVLMPILGLLQGIGPIMGYNHGMKQKKRVRKTLWTGIGLGAVFAVIMFGIMEIFPDKTASLFLDPKSPTMAVCAAGLRIQAIYLPLLPFNVLITAYLQSSAQGTKGLALSLSRQALIILAVMVLPVFFQLTGVWLAAPSGEAMTVILALGFLAAEKRSERPVMLNQM
ncbi:MAG: MATE family efflux transporter [Christensenellales bacterium]